MHNSVLIIGPSGTGKSTSIRNLDPKSTFLINVLGKSLPFRGSKKHYKPLTGWDDKKGNYYASRDWAKVLKCIQMVNQTRNDIKTIVIDDWQYLMAQEFMTRATETGFNKFSEMAQHAWLILNELMNLREDLFGFVLAHSDIDNQGVSRCKTIGKMLDEKVTVEGMFSCVLHTKVIDGEYVFLTQNDGHHIAKTPIDMFEETYIDNDLKQIQETIIKYNEGE